MMMLSSRPRGLSAALLVATVIAPIGIGAQAPAVNLPMGLTVGGDVVTSREAYIDLDDVPIGRPAEVLVEVKNLGTKPTVVDAFGIGPDISARWKDGDANLATRAHFGAGSSKTLILRVIIMNAPSRRALPLVDLATDGSPRNLVSIVYSPQSAIVPVSVTALMTSGYGDDFSHNRMCLPSPPPNYRVVDVEPSITGSERGCQSWGTCTVDNNLQPGEGACEIFGVQGRAKDGLFGNASTVTVSISLSAKYVLNSTQPKLFDAQALAEAMKSWVPGRSEGAK